MSRKMFTQSLWLVALMVSVIVAAVFVLNVFQGNGSNIPVETERGIVSIISDVPRDAIPPLDFPKYETAAQSNTWLSETDFVIGVRHNGDARAYPVKIMNWHEIVNETIGGEDVVVTYCPLCNSAVVFERHLGKRGLTFGNTGALYESAMVMYDRQTESYWWHINGEAIKGDLTGERLTIFPSQFTTWGEWKTKWPESRVLSINTGHSRDYLRDPYRSYNAPNSKPAFPVSIESDLLPPKERVIGVSLHGFNKAYPVKMVAGKTISDTIGDTDVIIVGNPTGTGAEIFFKEKNGKAGNRVPSISLFWFAWFVAYPDTDVYGL